MTIYGLTLITLHVLSIGQGTGRFAGGRSGVCAISGVCATTLDMPSLKSLLFGDRAFDDCHHVVFESEWIEERMMTRLA